MENTLPTLKQIAKQLKLSISTVSRELHNHRSIGLSTKLRVQKLAKEINYEPNQTAILFQQRRMFTMGVILLELYEAFFSSAIIEIEDCAYQNNCTLIRGPEHYSE